MENLIAKLVLRQVETTRQQLMKLSLSTTPVKGIESLSGLIIKSNDLPAHFAFGESPKPPSPARKEKV